MCWNLKVLCLQTSIGDLQYSSNPSAKKCLRSFRTKISKFRKYCNQNICFVHGFLGFNVHLGILVKKGKIHLEIKRVLILILSLISQFNRFRMDIETVLSCFIRRLMSLTHAARSSM